MSENYLKKELYELVKESSEIFEFIQSGSLDGMWYWDLENPENEWMSDRFWELFGIDPSTKKHKADEWQDIIFEDDLKVAFDNFNKHIADPNHPYDQIVRYRHAEGHTIWVRCRGMAIRDESGKPLRMLGSHQDITELMRLQEQLEESNIELMEKQIEVSKLNKILRRYANTDRLTGLYNRYFLDGVLDIEIEKARRNNTTFSVAIFDLRHFKKINDTYGHLVGDLVLKDFSEALKNALRKQDVVCRYGGDEFLVVFTETNQDQMANIKDKLIRYTLSRSLVHDKDIVEYSASIGTSTYLIDEPIDETIKRADKELYKYKENS